MDDPNNNLSPRICPMCGKDLETNRDKCPACGETFPSKINSLGLDCGIALTMAAISALTCGRLIANAVSNLGGEPAVGVAALMSVWLWGTPLLLTAVINPNSSAWKFMGTRWRVFWQTQAAMYVISLGLYILCLGVCTSVGVGPG